MTPKRGRSPWRERAGVPLWRIPRPHPPRRLERDLEVDFAVVGGGFTGLALALSLGRLAPGARVAVFEKNLVGAGGSGASGGIALEGTAAGDLPEGVSALAALRALAEEEGIECRLRLGGIYELSRSRGEPAVGELRFAYEGELRPACVDPGGDLDPGLYLGGLLGAAERRGAEVWEGAAVTGLETRGGRVRLDVGRHRVEAGRAVFATNGVGLPLASPEPVPEAYLTFAIATAPLGGEVLAGAGWAGGLPFETLERPFLWGRTTTEGRVVVGSGLSLDPAEGPDLCARLEGHLRGLHPAFRDVAVTHAWWGPVVFPPDRRPRLEPLGEGGRVWVAGCYAGHGVALSALFGRELARHLVGLPSAVGLLAGAGAPAGKGEAAH